MITQQSTAWLFIMVSKGLKSVTTRHRLAKSDLPRLTYCGAWAKQDLSLRQCVGHMVTADAVHLRICGSSLQRRAINLEVGPWMAENASITLEYLPEIPA